MSADMGSWVGTNAIRVGKRSRHRPAPSTEPAATSLLAGSIEYDNQTPGQTMSEGDLEPLETSCAAVSHAAALHAQGYLLLATEERRAKVQRFAGQLRKAYSDGLLQLACLPTLTRLNVLDAMARIGAAMGFSIKGLCRDDLVSPFNQHGPLSPFMSTMLASCPANLLPTPTQQAIVHHPWIDLIPIPQLRDNILIAMHRGLIDDDDELCADLLRCDSNREDKAALIVWSDPCNIRAWEASVPFLQKWGWLMQGCLELYVATNEWRAKRGEKRLAF
jgi:hypothetical protein